MKFAPFFFLFGVLLLATGCKDDDGLSQDILAHDGNNLTGPILPAGLHELSARFTAAQVASFTGRELETIRFFLGEIPQRVEIVIYGQGTPTSPGPVRYERDITNRITTTGWNNHVLNAPIAIQEEDIWITVAVTHDRQMQSVGCDAGPNKAGGDFILYANDSDWTTFRQSSGESVNWNIRAILRPQ